MAPRCRWTRGGSFEDHCDNLPLRVVLARHVTSPDLELFKLEKDLNKKSTNDKIQSELHDAGRLVATPRPGRSDVDPSLRAKPVILSYLPAQLTATCALLSVNADPPLVPKEARDASLSWFNRVGGPANPVENLFHAMLVLNSPILVKDLDVWAAQVLQQEGAYVQQGAQWQVPDEWKSTRSTHAPVMKVLIDAACFPASARSSTASPA